MRDPDATDSSTTRRRGALAAVGNRTMAVIAVVAMLLPVACFPSDPGPQGAIGVRLANGNIVARLHACGESQLVSSVELYLSGDVSAALWLIESQQGSRRADFTVGVAPPGFEAIVPLSEELRPGIDYFLVAAQPGHVLTLNGVTFDPAELRSDVWLVSGNRRLSDDEFKRLDPC